MIMTRIASLVVGCFAVACIVAGCGKADEITPKQQAAFTAYLDKQGWEYDAPGGVYRYISNASREGRDAVPAAGNGDSLAMYYAIYAFSGATSAATGAGTGALIYTNVETLLASDTILNRQYWSFDPLRVKLGTTPVIEGLELGLGGCRQGDSVQLYITSDLAYGGKSEGVIPRNTPVVFLLNIQNVKK